MFYNYGGWRKIMRIIVENEFDYMESCFKL